MPPIGTFEPRSSATISHEMRELRLTDRSLTLEPPPPPRLTRVAPRNCHSHTANAARA